MSVTRIHEDPRVTKPYTDEQWRKIEALGHQVDADLKAHDVRLTMGGEPTFVSIDDMDGDEWNTAALGPEKYRRADTSHPASARPLRAGRLSASRAGQMVSGRIAAAMGAGTLLAQRRRAHLARSGSGGE